MGTMVSCCESGSEAPTMLRESLICTSFANALGDRSRAAAATAGFPWASACAATAVVKRRSRRGHGALKNDDVNKQTTVAAKSVTTTHIKNTAAGHGAAAATANDREKTNNEMMAASTPTMPITPKTADLVTSRIIAAAAASPTTPTAHFVAGTASVALRNRLSGSKPPNRAGSVPLPDNASVWRTLNRRRISVSLLIQSGVSGGFSDRRFRRSSSVR